MRMKELVARSGLPRTTIHYYFRERLLEAPVRSAPNAATYTQRHIERLHLIQRLRSGDLGPLPVAQVRRALQLVDLGAAPEEAAALQRSVADGVDTSGPRYTRAQLARESGLAAEDLDAFIEAGLLIPEPNTDEEQFGILDVEAARVYRALNDQTSLNLDDGANLVDQIREVVSCEMSLRRRAITGLDIPDAVRVTHLLQHAANVMHRYLFLRLRQTEIGRLEKAGQL